MGSLLRTQRMLYNVAVRVLVFSISTGCLASCSLISRETSQPERTYQAANWLELSFSGDAAQGATEKELANVHWKVNAGQMTATKREIETLLSSEEVVVDMTVSGLDGDSRTVVLAIIGRPYERYGERLLILSSEDGETRKIWKDMDMAKLKPWKVESGDVDGDGAQDILVGVYKKTRFDPKMNNRLFVYDWDEDGLFPKWLGSSLSLPFYDFAVGQIDGEDGDELVSLERLKGGSSRIMIYKWSGFGFLGDRYWNSSDSLRNLVLFDSDKDGDKEIFVER